MQACIALSFSLHGITAFDNLAAPRPTE
jgi:hypothetical protein